MIAIKGMEMPKSCIDCPFTKAEGTKFFCSRIMKYIDIKNLGNKHDDCPLVEIVTCKDCKYWHDDGIMTICDKNIGHGFPRDYFCASAFCKSTKGENE